MKVILSLLMILPTFFTASSYAEDPREELKRILTNFPASITTISDLQCNSEKLNIVDCNQNQSEELKYLVSLTKIQLLAIRNEMNNFLKTEAIKQNPKHMKNIVKIGKVLTCIDKKIKSTKYACINKECNALAYVRGIAFLRINTINLCPLFWNDKPDYKAATLVHELSHVCGTYDYEYLEGVIFDKAPASEKIEKVSVTYKIGIDETNNFKNEFEKIKDVTATNADTYYFWAKHGFCIPDLNCKHEQIQLLKKEE